MTKRGEVLQQIGYLFLGGTIPKEFFQLVKINNLTIESVYSINYGDDNVIIVSNENVGFIEKSLVNFNKEKVEYDENC